MHKPKLMLGKAADILADKPKDLISGKLVNGLLAVDIVVTGFSCKSVSMMNGARSKNHKAIEESSGKSGETLLCP